MKIGGGSDEKIDQYLEGIYNTVIVKDIEQRQARREAEGRGRKVTDIALLKTIARYLASVIGSPVSMKSITDYLISSGRKVSQNTVSDYVEALTESFVFYPVERFGIIKLFEGLSANWGTFCTPLCSKSCCIAVWFLSLGGGKVDSGSIGLIIYRYNSLFGIAGLPPSCYNNKNVDDECISDAENVDKVCISKI